MFLNLCEMSKPSFNLGRREYHYLTVSRIRLIDKINNSGTRLIRGVSVLHRFTKVTVILFFYRRVFGHYVIKYSRDNWFLDGEFPHNVFPQICGWRYVTLSNVNVVLCDGTLCLFVKLIESVVRREYTNWLISYVFFYLVKL